MKNLYTNPPPKQKQKKTLCLDFKMCTKLNVSVNSIFHKLFEEPS